MRIKLFAALAILALGRAASPLNRKPFLPHPALTYADLADLALARRSPRICGSRERRALGARTGAERPGRAPALPDRGRRRRADSRRRRPAGAGQLPRRPAERFARPAGPAAAPRRAAGPRPPGAESPGRAAAGRARRPARPTRPRPPSGCARSCANRAAADAPPRITGIGRAFHVPGSLPGESETQIFLQTADDRPISLTVLRRPGEQPRWSVALTEIVDEAAAPPAPRHLALVPARLHPAAAPAAPTRCARPAPTRRARSRPIIGW